MAKDLDDFWAEFNKHARTAASGSYQMIFRGVPNSAYKLIPSIGRETKEGLFGEIETLERNLMNDFKRLSLPVIESQPRNEFEWIFLAQHYGLPTRLLDWSTNPMVALFFAVETQDNKDGAIHIVNHQISDNYEDFDYKTANISEEAKKEKPILKIFALQPNQGNVIFVRPKYTDQRYLNQKSVFSCHVDPFEAYSCQESVKLKVNKEWKAEIRDHLRMMGISHSYIYPGLDGVSREVKKHVFEPVQNGKQTIASFSLELPPFDSPHP